MFCPLLDFAAGPQQHSDGRNNILKILEQWIKLCQEHSGEVPHIPNHKHEGSNPFTIWAKQIKPTECLNSASLDVPGLLLYYCQKQKRHPSQDTRGFTFVNGYQILLIA